MVLAIFMTSDGKSYFKGHRARLKEKFAREPSFLADYELLELLLGYVIPRRDVKPIARGMLLKAGSAAGLFSCDFSDVEGAGPQTELFLSAVRELYDRCLKSEVKALKKFNDPAAVYDFLKFSVAMGNKESFAVIYLNGRNGLISHGIMSRGTVDAASVFPREVAEAAVKAGAVSVIVAHNHPSGDTQPSKKDVEITKRIKDALAVLDITLADHIILAKNSYFSFSDMKLL